MPAYTKGVSRLLLDESDLIGPKLRTFHVTNNGHSSLGNKDSAKKKILENHSGRLYCQR